MRIRLGLAPAAVALALAVPSAAHAQGAGDDQYTDPFAGQATPTATPRPAAQATATPAPATPAPTQSSAAAPAPTQASAATPVPVQPAAPASSGPTLPYTGVDAWIPGLSGALLLGAGVALRVRLRDH